MLVFIFQKKRPSTDFVLRFFQKVIFATCFRIERKMHKKHAFFIFFHHADHEPCFNRNLLSGRGGQISFHIESLII